MPAKLRKSLVTNLPASSKTEKDILIDRNIASDIANFFEANCQDWQSREIALALVLFMNICKFRPAALPALQEFESVHRTGEAYIEVTKFCRAFSVSPEHHLKLLNKLSLNLENSDVPLTLKFPPLQPDTTPLKMSQQWLLSYITVLKLSVLERDSSISPIMKMEQFISWVYDNFIFTPPLLLTASQLFSPHRDVCIVKGTQSNSPDKLRKNIRNAAWDLHILHEWHIRVKKKEMCLLATRDTGLKKLANKLRTLKAGSPVQERLLLKEEWPTNKNIIRIYDLLKKYATDLENPNRPANSGLTYEYYLNLRTQLETQLGIYENSNTQFVSPMQ